MQNPNTLSRRPARRFWGWGANDDALLAVEEHAILAAIAAHGVAPPGPPPRLEEFQLAPPRLAPPPSLAAIFSATPQDRLSHAGGKSYADLVRMWLRAPPGVPDWVAYPDTEQSITDILDWATGARVAVIPFGGGSSVVGGTEPPTGDAHAATLSLDMERLGQVREVNRTSRAALIEAGAYGPDIEAALKPHGLTLRHFPQSFAYSTLGGWIATRAGGHYATLLTHIDDLVENTRMVTPSGIIETRRLPASGAGPAPDRLVLGSEGAFGVITAAWMRLQDRPKFRAGATARFADFPAAIAALRALAQSGLNPANARLLDAAEAAAARVGDGTAPLLIVAFESADHPVDPLRDRALELLRDHAATIEASGADADNAAAWRGAFLRMPFYRDPMVGAGIIVDTFESAITWDRFADFYDTVKQRVAAAIHAATGRYAVISCRITHVYPDGAAPYFTYMVPGPSGGLPAALAAWRDIKRACNEAVLGQGGTITHHHAVGRDHRDGYAAETPPLFRDALAAVKARLDPAGIMNPGVLLG